MENRQVLVYWQAHRGGGAWEAPDNTMAANRHAWKLGGIPEADIRTTKDGVLICLHDDTPARTTTAPEDVKDRVISEFTFEEIRRWDAGIKFDPSFAGEKIPSIEEVFAEMQGTPERQFYLDLKDVRLERLGELIDAYGVNGQVIFTHNRQENCIRMKTIANGVRTMLWIGGNPAQIRETYRQARDSGFEGLDQIQFHLYQRRDVSSAEEWPYELDAAFLQEALPETRAAGIDLEVFPMVIEKAWIQRLLEIGIRWYATDEPSKFLEYSRL